MREEHVDDAVTTALSLGEAEKSGLASGVVKTCHEVGGSIGVAVVSTVAAAGIAPGTVPGFAHAFTVTAAAAAAAVSAALCLLVVPRGRLEMGGVPHAR
ncbi:hypothetical protein [Actinacidiphila alni]|uniref:hypothetical protein n=1 Tax=Actinacidiphila alni TaxID=380248 RepID=UPI003455B984